MSKATGDRRRATGERTLALVVAYDGTDFAGSQVQTGARTVQADLEAAIGGLYGNKVRVVFAGRTDRGVHAAGQAASCEDRRPDLRAETIRQALNARLPEDVAVTSVGRRDGGFHARYDAVWREYRYRIWCGTRQPLIRRQAWQRTEPLNVAEMAQAAANLVGEHDFAAFAGGGEGVPWSESSERRRGTVRRVLRCHCRTLEPWWGASRANGTLIEVRVVADGFLPRMVRTMTGVLAEIGRGARPVSWIDEVRETRDRRAAGTTAPPHGLILWRVGYGDDVPDADPVMEQTHDAIVANAASSRMS